VDALKAHTPTPRMWAYWGDVKHMIASRVTHVLTPT
jgi:hypothetical protein